MTRSTKTRGHPTRRKTTPIIVVLVAGGAMLLLLIGWNMLSGAPRNTPPSSGSTMGDQARGQGRAEMPHMHGLGFSHDGRQLFVAAHDGLRAFADGTWSTPDIPPHDYMGYSPTDNGFYSSGHPANPRVLINPFGLIKSTDGGKTLTKLGFEGESDFHIMGVGYTSHAIYVLNPAPNSKLPPGLHSSLDDAKTWKPSVMQGVTAQPIQIAVHPTDPDVVALATEGGLMLSSNAGATFERIGTAEPVTAAAFSPRGEQLFFGYTTLSVYNLADKKVMALPMPGNVGNDAVSAIAVNPVRPDEIAFASFERHIYLSQNGGQSWKQIAQAGKGVALK